MIVCSVTVERGDSARPRERNIYLYFVGTEN